MKIINIVGKSGAGKTHLVELAQLVSDINVIESFTTRKPRYDGEEGHIFIEDLKLISAWDGNTFRYKVGDYYYSVWEEEIVAHQSLYDADYFAIDNQFKKDRVNVYVVDEKGAKEVTEYYADDPTVEVINILLFVEDTILRRRLIDREHQQLQGDEWLDLQKAYQRTMVRYDKDKYLEFDTGFYTWMVSNNESGDSALLEFWDDVLYDE